MNYSKKPVCIYPGEGIMMGEYEQQDHVEYHLSVNEIAIKQIVERVLVAYATEVEELKQRISHLEGKLERLESRNG